MDKESADKKREEMLRNTKQFLRAVLISSQHGVKQSKIEREYKDITGEMLLYRKLGYRNLFDFLVSSPDVCKLEFRAEDEDNRVFAVVDKESFTSVHAKKATQKGWGRGTKAKSPQEILEYKKLKKQGTAPEEKEQLCTGRIPLSERTVSGKNEKINVTIVNGDDSMLDSEIDVIRKSGELIPNLEGIYGLYIRVKRDDSSASRNMPQKDDIRKYFSKYGKVREAKFVNSDSGFVKYETFKEAATALVKGNDAKINGWIISVCPAKERKAQDTMINQTPNNSSKRNNIKSMSSNVSNPGSKSEIATLVDLKTNSFKMAKSGPGSVGSVDSATVEDDLLLETNTGCGFPLDFKAMEKLHSMTCKRQPKTAANIPEKINFLITYIVDPCRFWIHCEDSEDSYTRLLKLQTELANAKPVFRSDSPDVDHLGAALYAEDGAWYRCWVLETIKSKNELKVFYCDYGNYETISVNNFKYIDPKYWTLPPQAIPAKFHGLESTYRAGSEGANIGKKYLESLTTGKLLIGQVVRSSNSKEPHVIELRDVVEKLDQGTKIDSLVGENVFVYKTNNDCSGKAPGKSAYVDIGIRSPTRKKGLLGDAPPGLLGDFPLSNQRPDALIPAGENNLFSYHQSSLKRVKITEIQSTQLFFFQLEQMDSLTELKDMLFVFEPEEPAKAEIGSLVCVKILTMKCRAKILQLDCNFPTTGKVQLLDVDQGNRFWVTADCLYKLSKELLFVQYHARPAALANVHMSSKAVNAKSLLEARARDSRALRVLGMHVIHELKDGKILCELFDLEHPTSINVQLIKAGYAKKGSDEESSFGSTLIDDNVSERSASNVGKLPDLVLGTNNRQIEKEHSETMIKKPLYLPMTPPGTPPRTPPLSPLLSPARSQSSSTSSKNLNNDLKQNFPISDPKSNHNDRTDLIEKINKLEVERKYLSESLQNLQVSNEPQGIKKKKKQLELALSINDVESDLSRLRKELEAL